MEKFKLNDRVRRRPFIVALPVEEAAGETIIEMNGEAPVTTVTVRCCIGTVKSLREETTSKNQDARERSIMVQVLWDDGTFSYHGPEGLDLAG